MKRQPVVPTAVRALGPGVRGTLSGFGPPLLLLLWLLGTASPWPVAAQETEVEDPGPSVGLMAGDWGVALGHRSRVTGLRMNVSDTRLDRVTGVNLTLWKPNPPVGGSVNGLALGVVAPAAGRIRGVSAGGGGVLAGESLLGVQLGGLGVVSEGTIRGISAGGLGVVAQSDLDGVAFGGLGVVSQGHVRGALLGGLGVVAEESLDGLGVGLLGVVTEGQIRGGALGGLGVVAQGGLRGLSAGGLGVVSEGHVEGLTVSGLGLVAQGQLRGFSAAGLGTVVQGGTEGVHLTGGGMVSQGPMLGLQAAGLAVVAQQGATGASLGGLTVVSGAHLRGLQGALGTVDAQGPITGMTLTGYKTEAPRVTGLHGAVGWMETDELRGVSAAAYHQIEGIQVGLTIGIYNSADHLRGVQLGLLNRAGNNRPPFRYLPVINASF